MTALIQRVSAELVSANKLGDVDLANLLREVATALQEAREDRARLDWFDANWFSAYRESDPIHGLAKHCVLVDESKRTRRGIVKDAIREAIDAAREARNAT